jgi:hypothetical protein
MKASTSRISRRNFLAVVGAGGVATAAAVVAKKRQEQPEKATSTRATGKGYQLTEHVRKYYDTTKV